MQKIIAVISSIFLLMSLAYGQALKTNISVHDPVMIKQDNLYYIFCTGYGIAIWSSSDRINWKPEAPVFKTAPVWAATVVPGFNNYIWAPDISYYKGKYYLYYAVSAFGKNTSAIGLATNTTLHTDDPAYKWEDHGIVLQSIPGKDNWNAIDPNLIIDKSGTPYLAFGSFWEGLKIVRLKADRMHTAQSLANLPTIASRKKSAKDDLPAVDGNPANAGGNAIEAPFIFSKGGYFYLFASIDYCCKGPQSTYKMIVGRSKKVTGPYIDMEGVSMAHGGGTLLLAGDKNWYGVGHNAVVTFDDIDYLVFHAYDAADKGISKLRIEKITWKNEWPTLNTK